RVAPKHPGGSACSGRIYLYSLFLDVLIRLKASVRITTLNRLIVERTVAFLCVAFNRTGWTYAIPLNFVGISPGSICIGCLGSRGWSKKRKAETRDAHEGFQAVPSCGTKPTENRGCRHTSLFSPQPYRVYMSSQ